VRGGRRVGGGWEGETEEAEWGGRAPERDRGCAVTKALPTTTTMAKMSYI